MSESFRGNVHAPADFAAETWAPAEFDLHSVDHLAETFHAEDATDITPQTAAELEAARLEREAQQLETQRQQEIADAVAAAYARGFEDGRTDGEKAEGARTRNAVRAAEHALDELRAGESKWQGMIEENVCALAIAVARQVIGRELNMDGEAIADLVRRALAEFPIDHAVRIRVNPLDLSAITMCTNAEGQPITIAPGREVRWQADASIAPGGCVVEGRDRIVDGRVDTALERLYRRLTYTNA